MNTPGPFTDRKTRQLTLIAMGTALSLATNYLLLGFENVKLMDLIVFMIGFVAGPVAGASTGMLTWSVYGTMNPNGFSLPVWLATMLGETLYGVAGGVVGRRLPLSRAGQQPFRVNVLLGVLGLGLTFAYDILTTLAHAWVFGISLAPQPFSLYLLLSLPFFVAHEASNLLLFSTIAVPVMRPLSNLYMRYV